MHMNLLAVLVAAFVPLVIGLFWYNPKVLGTAWMKASGMTEEKAKNANMLLVFGLTFVFSFILAFGLQFMCIHQFHITSSFFDYMEQIKNPDSPEGSIYKQVMDLVGNGHRTFGHGALHGVIGGIMMSLPIIGVNALFESKGFKYIIINVGFWVICMGLMGGIVSAWM